MSAQDRGMEWLRTEFPGLFEPYIEQVKAEERQLFGPIAQPKEPEQPAPTAPSTTTPRRGGWSYLENSQAAEDKEDD